VKYRANFSPLVRGYCVDNHSGILSLLHGQMAKALIDKMLFN